MSEIQKVTDTTYEVELPCGDKVEIGDREAIDFKPHIKLNRWDGECFIAIQPAGEIEEEVEVEVEGNKVKCKYKIKQGEFEFEWESEFYALEPRTVIAKDKDGKDVPFTQNELGGFEFEVILKKKPKTNKTILNVGTQGLKFCYQPELTPQEITEGCIRPDNVVGSYAVYHATRGNIHKGKADAEKYKCGKAFHIYRPKITDAGGKWVWGELSLDEQAGTLTTTIPQDFLDDAVYPVIIDPNFGYETEGGSNIYGSADRLRRAGVAYTGGAGTGISMSIYGDAANASSHVKLALYKDSDGTLVRGTDEITQGSVTAWSTGNFTSPPTLEAIDYWLVLLQNEAQNLNYDTGDDKYLYSARTYEDGFPADSISWTESLTKAIFSIYCTYEVGGVDYPISLSPGLTASVSIDRALAWDRGMSPGLTMAVTVVRVFGRLITTNTALVISTTISKQVVFARAVIANLTATVSVVRAWTKTIVTTADLAVSVTVTIIKGFVRSVVSNLTASTTIDRTVAYDRATTAGLTVSATIARIIAYYIVTQSALSVAVSVIRVFGKTITSTTGLTVFATVSRVVAYKRAVSTGLTLAVSIIASYVSIGIHYFISTTTNLTVSVTIHYCVVVLRKLLRVPIGRLDISRLPISRKEFWRRIRSCFP